MNSIIKCENYRLRVSKEIRLMFGLLCGVQMLCTTIVLLLRHFHLMDDMMLGESADSFLNAFTGTADDTIFRILLIIMIGSLVTKLYQSGVNKQLVSSGIGRRSIILGQFISYTAIFGAVAAAVSVVTGICNMIQGGGFGFGEMNPGRFGLSLMGMILVIASLCAMYLLITHLTGSFGAAISLGLAIELVLPTVFTFAGMIRPLAFLSDYSIAAIQSSAISTTVSIGKQLSSMGLLVVITAVLLMLCQVIFSRKEIK